MIRLCMSLSVFGFPRVPPRVGGHVLFQKYGVAGTGREPENLCKMLALTHLVLACFSRVPLRVGGHLLYQEVRW